MLHIWLSNMFVNLVPPATPHLLPPLRCHRHESVWDISNHIVFVLPYFSGLLFVAVIVMLALPIIFPFPASISSSLKNII